MTDKEARLPTATLDICLLAMIEVRDSYGYELIQQLKDEGFPVANDRSVYPLLGKLAADGLLETYLQSSSGGPARKYYRISDKGRSALRVRARRSFDLNDVARRIVTARVDIHREPTSRVSGEGTLYGIS